MQFKHPELLYALFLLLIPIIIHLFQLRKFKVEYFTNVAFLKKVKKQTRKSSQLKKWLILLTRLLLLTALILAFAQPYFSKQKGLNTVKETVIYLDNSFSMQAKGKEGELYKRAIQDIITHVPEDETISLFTNTETFRNTTLKAIKNELIELPYASNQLTYDALQLKANKLFTKNKNTTKNVVYISDFQSQTTPFAPIVNADTAINTVQLHPENTNNVSIDSVYVSKQTSTQLECTVKLSNYGNPSEQLSISVYNDDILLAKTALDIKGTGSTTFDLPKNEIIKGKIVINDNLLQFDNTLYFSVNKPAKINVLSINNSDSNYLSKLFTDDEFKLTQTKLNTLQYNVLSESNLVVLNELNTLPLPLQTALKEFSKQGGSIIVIPSKTADIETYNAFLLQLGFSNFSKLNTSEKRITTINYGHPLYSNGVFEKQVTNFQYPKVNSYFPQALGSAKAILQYEDSKPFLSQRKNTYVFSASISEINSNFKGINLIVPTFYNIGKQSLNTSNLYYSIGKTNVFDVPAELAQDGVLQIENTSEKLIPQQHYFNKKVKITTTDLPSKSGIFNITNNNAIVEYVSYNYDRLESKLDYQDISLLKNVNHSDSVNDVFTSLKNESKINMLWKWFVIFALVCLVLEMLILKYFK